MPKNFNTIPSLHTFSLSSSDEKLQSFQGGRTILRQPFVGLIDIFVLVKPSRPSRKSDIFPWACRPQKSNKTSFGAVWMARPHVVNSFMELMKNAVTAA
jgi:hypothetical protein